MSSNREGAVIARILIEASSAGWRLFRNSTGQAWAGRQVGETILGGGIRAVILEAPRRISFGLAVGSSDLIGWRPVTITPDMVGRTIAQFVALEAKSDGYKTVTEEQGAFLAAVARAGGYAAVARPGGQENVEISPISID